jgi:hypothetical protein
MQNPLPGFAPHIAVPAQPVNTVDINAVFANRRFANSRDEIGLQMADVAISDVRRAMTGTLQRTGWRRLGSLLVRSASYAREVIGMIQIGGEEGRWRPQPIYEKVLLTLRGAIQPVVPHDFVTCHGSG